MALRCDSPTHKPKSSTNLQGVRTSRWPLLLISFVPMHGNRFRVLLDVFLLHLLSPPQLTLVEVGSFFGKRFHRVFLFFSLLVLLACIEVSWSAYFMVSIGNPIWLQARKQSCAQEGHIVGLRMFCQRVGDNFGASEMRSMRQENLLGTPSSSREKKRPAIGSSARFDRRENIPYFS